MYALRNRETGEYVAAPTRSRARTLTGSELASIDDAVPRLFHTRAAARRALTWWCKGTVSVRYDYNGDEDWRTEPRGPYVVSQMYVVEIGLVKMGGIRS